MTVDLNYIRDHYQVPARLEGRIRFTWAQWDGDRNGSIVGADGARLKVLFDSGEFGHLHPTWEIEYLPTEAVAR